MIEDVPPQIYHDVDEIKEELLDPFDPNILVLGFKLTTGRNPHGLGAAVLVVEFPGAYAREEQLEVCLCALKRDGARDILRVYGGLSAEILNSLCSDRESIFNQTPKNFRDNDCFVKLWDNYFLKDVHLLV